MHWSGGTLLVLAVFINGCSCQFGEIASLATSLLGSALGGGGGLGALAGAGAAGAGAAGQAAGALGQIGQLYKLAEGALQLTGTGVGVLNQASEGNWFPAVLEQTAKNSQALMKGNGLNLGALGPAPAKGGAGGAIGPEFGTSFPAPDIDDYDENAEIPGLGKDKKAPKPPDGLIDIDSGDYELATPETPQPETEEVTEGAKTEEEEETTEAPTTPPQRQIRIQLPDKNGNTSPEAELDYEDLIKGSAKSNVEAVQVSTIDAESTEELKKNLIATHGTKNRQIVPKLDKLVEVLQKSKLSKEEIAEIVSQVEGNRHIEKPPKYDFNSNVQNIPDKKINLRQKITEASRVINTNIDNQRKEQTITLQKQVDELRVLPDLAQSVSKPAVPAVGNAPIHPRSIPQPTQPQVQATAGPVYNYGYTPQPQQQQYHQYYQTNAPFYGQQTQNNYWAQNYNQQRQYVGNQAQVQQPQQPQQTYPQQQQQAYYNQYPRQQIPQQPYQQPQGYQQQQYQTQQQQYQQQQQQYQQQQQQHYQQRIPAQYQQQPTRPTVQPQQIPTAQVSSNSNQVFHYYHDGKQVVQQIIPKQIATNGNLPLNGPFKSQNSAAAAPTDPVEYQRRQRELSHAYLQPQTRGNNPSVGKAVAARQVNQRSASAQPSANVKPKVYQSTVTANSNRQAHAIRTYEPTKIDNTSKTDVQGPSVVRSSGRSTSRKVLPRVSGHVLPGPTIDHRSLQEKRTTAKPRIVRMP